MSRMEKFEKVWADRHGVPAETLVQYRFESKEGYRLPGMAAHYRTYCDTLDSVVVNLPNMERYEADGVGAFCDCLDAIEAAGLRVAP
jgi:hypothetical protein